MRERFTAVEGCVKGVAFSDGHGFVCSRGHETKHVLVRHLFDLAAHLEDVLLGLDDVGARHQEERIRRLEREEEMEQDVNSGWCADGKQQQEFLKTVQAKVQADGQDLGARGTRDAAHL